MTGGKVWQYPYVVRLFHTSTPLRSVELSKEWQRVHDWGKVRQYPYFVRLFHTSTPLRSVELRMKKESRDLVASPGHLWRVKGKITSIAFFHASFADFSLPFQLCRIRSVYNALVNPHFDYSRGVGIFLWVARPYESEYFETYNIFLHESAFWREPGDQKSIFFKPRWFKARSRRMQVRKTAVSTMRY